MSAKTRARHRWERHVDRAEDGATPVIDRGQATAEYAVTLGAFAGLLAAVWTFSRLWFGAMRDGAVAAAQLAGRYF